MYLTNFDHSKSMSNFVHYNIIISKYMKKYYNIGYNYQCI